MSVRARATVLAAATVAAVAAPDLAAGARLGFDPVGVFDQPTHVAADPARPARLYVVERAGRIVVLKNGRRLAQPLLDLRGQVDAGGERGLLSLAFGAGGFAYVFWTASDGESRVEELAPDGSRRLVLTLPAAPAHNGGQVAVGPDGLLYIGVGDHGWVRPQNPQRAQDPAVLPGKILRVDPRGGTPYAIPADNPYVGVPGVRPEIWALGLRNPWRFSFDRATGMLVAGDVGEKAFEEIDVVERGANLGWPCREGPAPLSDPRYVPCDAPGAVGPVLARPFGPACSVIGGHVMRDPAIRALAGRYVYGDFCDPGLRSARLGPGGATDDRPLGPRIGQLVSFGEDACGRLHTVSLTGRVRRMVDRARKRPSACPPARSVRPGRAARTSPR